MAAHRYWRVHCTVGNGEPNFSVGEIELRTSISGADQTGSGTPTLSSGTTATSAFDNNNSTLATTTSGTFPHWIKYDFGAGNDKDIVELTMFPRSQVRYMPTTFTLDYSDNDSTWTTLYSFDGYGEWGILVTANVFNVTRLPTDGASGTFWRVNCTVADGAGFFSVGEIRMYSAGSATNECTGGLAFSQTQLDTGGPASFAFNELSGSSSLDRWSSFTLPAWVGYKFASAKTIDVIGITARVTGQTAAPRTFTVQYWNGSSFTTAMTLTGITGWTSGQTRYFNASGETTAPVASTGRPVVCVCT